MTLEGGKVLVRGASGGVGALAVLMLSNLGYKVVASTGNKHAGDKLEALGANEIIDRITDNDEKPLGSRTCKLPLTLLEEMEHLMSLIV